MNNIKILLESFEFEIWISSSRRREISLEKMSEIFVSRGLQQIKGFIPEGIRLEFIKSFVSNIENYLIIDDNKSLNQFQKHIKDNLILTRYSKGFDIDKLLESINICKSMELSSN